jgi:hypothetical protein
MSETSSIGLSRKQRVFAVLETTMGTLEFPSAANFIRPAGNAVINQNPEFSDSIELEDTLDVLDVFPNAMPAGDFTIPMYIRPNSTFGSDPQGSCLFESLMGEKNPETTAALLNLIDATVSTIAIDTISGGTFPEKGVITIGTEKIHYTGLTQTYGATTATLTGATRGYDSTTAAATAADVAVTLSSVFYKQKTTSPSITVWVETDHMVQALSGASVNAGEIGLTNEGAVTINITGQGMRMYWAGTTAMAATTASGLDVLSLDSGKHFSVGMFIQNKTTEDTNSGAGYEILSVSTTAATMTVTPALAHPFSENDVISGYLPDATVIGDPIEGRYSSVEIDSVEAKIKTGTLNVNAPKQYITDEVGTEYPEDFLEDVREITSDIGLYFRKADVKYFQDGFANTEESTVLVTCGQTAGNIFEAYMKRTKLKVPTIEIASPAVELKINMKALGTNGEDSLELYFR